ncbi:nicotinamidase-related amidase [Bacillus ectoiniformans]|uniref:hypothetical protein n=1 Tax=Bacillus ectoiniformans TaxID=1494429 RepID=UPI00195B0DEE|nr:hypothetical protein [Bacillus ectoiniformans]MBM7648454.1 nicotinamidase-related amidase [Bacillus ectoiniformans]
MKTSFDTIVNIDEIGSSRSVKMNELLSLASAEGISPSNEDTEKVLFIGIDYQNDFMENGELGVPNSHTDIKNVTRFLYDNFHKITDIAISLDTHELNQIFHPVWWLDEQGNHPAPFTIISAEDIEKGKWTAAEKAEESLKYIRNLEKSGKKQLCIWPYHCIEGTRGAALESQFSNMIHFHSIARNTRIKKIIKGQDPLSEMYGIIKPEFAEADYGNYEFLNSLKSYQKIIIAGEAKSHCVLESVKQMVDYFADDREMTARFYVLDDCISSIPGFEEETEQAYEELKNKFGIHIVRSKELTL